MSEDDDVWMYVLEHQFENAWGNVVSDSGQIFDVKSSGGFSYWVDANGRGHFKLDGCRHGDVACLRCRVLQARHLRRMGNSWRLSLSPLRNRP